jgi:hypothetical protein
MKHKRQWEPGVFVRVLNQGNREMVFSFGELFNSRLGDQVVIATIKERKPLSPEDGFAVSVTGEDSTGGRFVKRIQTIEVRQANSQLGSSYERIERNLCAFCVAILLLCVDVCTTGS